jgi:serine/threonine protein kinase
MKAGLGTETGGADPTAQARFTPPTPQDLATVFPQFEIISFIGQGGMGAVYKARQKQLDRIVALKILPPSIGKDPAFAERFAREARAMAKLNHPGIVTIYDFGQAQGGADHTPAQLYFFIMEFVDGVSLRQLLQAGRVAPREALAIVPQICDALQYAHDQGIVHRDIKPENILLDRQGRVKVADFGLAKLVGAGTDADVTRRTSQSVEGLTDAGKILGTPNYMAPEQAEHPAEVDHRADLYALGVVFYQMLTGELPAKRIEPPSRKVHVDVRLDEIVLRALERVPERRYQSAGELKTVVETVAAETMNTASANDVFRAQEGQAEPEPPVIASLSGGSETGTALPLPALAPDTVRRSRVAVAGAASLLIFLLALVAWLLVRPSEAPIFGRTFPQLVASNVILPLGFAALLASTILGWVAVVQIRRSAGRIRGLGLAVFDGLCLPIMITDAFIFIFWTIAAKIRAARWGLGGSMFRNLWEFAAYSLLIGLTVAFVNYLIISPVWRALAGKAAGDDLDSAARTRRRLLVLSIILGLAVTALVPATMLLPESPRKARYGWGVEPGTRLNYQVFEADADIVDHLIPFDAREPGKSITAAGVYTLAPSYTAAAQTAEIDNALLSALIEQAATNSGILVNATKKGEEIYEWRPDTWTYTNADVSGRGEGFCGMGRNMRSTVFRISYKVIHNVSGNARYPLSAEISYEGPTPPEGKARAFVIPFSRDQHSKYLVIAFDAKTVSKDTDQEPQPNPARTSSASP